VSAGTGKTRVHSPPAGRSVRGPVEQLAEAVLKHAAGDLRATYADPDTVQKVLRFRPRSTRAVIIGGGTGLSTVVGGNTNLADWAERPFVGLKEEFPHLDVVVCSTDDGGSTGRLLKRLPMIAVGDLRKSFVSLVRRDALRNRYKCGSEQALNLVRLIRRVFTYRFDSSAAGRRILRDPLLAAPPSLRPVCPQPLAAALRSLGRYLSPGGRGPAIDPAGHSLGNLILTAAIFRAARGRTDRPPRLRDIRRGLNELGKWIGVAGARLHAATATPGQLKFRYTNGVEVYGQSKSAAARRGCPVEWLAAEFVEEPVVSAAVSRAIRNADLIVYAPGSLYTSIIPVLQLRPIVDAIRANRKALKILGANFWIQEGETDISLRQEGRGFLVSDLIEAYGRNVPGGAAGLFHVILSANLEQLPGNILRNYALEGKSPIHLDRARVEKMGFQPFEATLFSPDFQTPARVIHHDPERFSLVVRTLLYAHHAAPGRRNRLEKQRQVPPSIGSGTIWGKRLRRVPLLCDYIQSIRAALEQRRYIPARLKGVLLDLAWENRDILPAHLGYFAGARVIPAREWNRSTEWDNVLGYFDPEDRFLKIHEQLLSEHARLREDLLIALGESLLGRYIDSRRWIEYSAAGQSGARCYQMRLRPPKERECYLSDTQLRKYLALARMLQAPGDPLVYQITVNDNEGFLPPGLLFGLLYAWYLNNRYAATMEYEMSILRWSPRSLIPHQAAERIRKQCLVKFFRTDVFGHARAEARA
jgi:uncharacterized cofD-like protein